MKKAKLVEQKKKKKEENTKQNFSLKKLIIILVVILIVLMAFYFLTDFIVKKQNKNNVEEPEQMVNVRSVNDINYSDVDSIVSSSYYLLVNVAEDENNEKYDAYINLLKYAKYPDEFYYIDLSKEANKSLIAEKSSLDSLKDLKVKETTLLYINDGKVSKKYEGSDAILEYLSSFFATSDDEGNNTSDSKKSENDDNSATDTKKSENDDNDNNEDSE